MKTKFTQHFCAGLFSILGIGTYTISAQNNIPIDSIVVKTVNSTSNSVVSGGTLQLSATVYPLTANQEVKWSSLDIMTSINKDGLVKANVVGDATVRATSVDNTQRFKNFSINILQPNEDYTEVNVGAGALLTNVVPILPTFNYSYTQSLYLGSQIEMPKGGKIEKLRWYFSGETKLPNAQDITVYLGNTDKAKYTGSKPNSESQNDSNDWILAKDMKKVYQGPMIVGDDGWIEIVFDTPFLYDGTSNLVVATNDNFNDNNTADSRNDKFYSIHPFVLRSIYQGTNLEPISPETPIKGWLTFSIPDIILVFRNENLTTQDVLLSESSFVVYPNPANSQAIIKANKAIENIIVYNMNAQIVLQSTSTTLDINKLPIGNYIVKTIFKDQSSATKKLIKK